MDKTRHIPTGTENAELEVDKPAESCAQGDVNAGATSFETLLARLLPTLKRISRKLNGHFCFVDDQDLFQEALLHLWTRFTAGDLKDKTDSYMLQGCYYHLKNYVRKTHDNAIFLSLSAADEDEGRCLWETLVTNDIVPLEKAEGELQIDAMMESGMTQREKDVLNFSLEGMTTREIGLRLGVSHVSVVKTRNKIKERYERLCGIGGTDVTAGFDGMVTNGIASRRHNLRSKGSMSTARRTHGAASALMN